MNMDVRQHQYAQNVEQKRKEIVRERHVNAYVLNNATFSLRSFARLKLIAMDVLHKKCASLKRKTTTVSFVKTIQRLMVVPFYAMSKMVSVRVFHQKTYLDAEVQHTAYNAKQ